MWFTKSIKAAVGGSLKLKLSLLIIGILGITIGIAPWGAIKVQQHQLLQGARDRLNSLHEMVRRSLVDTAMDTGHRGTVDRLLVAISSHRGIAEARIFTTEGTVLHSSRGNEIGTRLSSTELTRYQGRVDPVIESDSQQGVIYTLVRPMFNGPECASCHVSGSKILGILQVTLSLEETWQQLGNLRKGAFFATLITLAVVVLSVWLSLTVLIDQPLQRMGAVMAKVKSGDLSAHTKVASNDELGQLGHHLNDMISKLHEAQKQLERYHHSQLARADRLATIGEMASAIAHEIRNPLTGISGALSVLSRDFPEGDSRREIVRQTRLLIERLNNSVEDILLYSRPSRPQLQAVKAEEIIDRACSLVDGEARKAQVQLVWEGASGTNSDAASPAVQADPQQIQQVIMNLALNAIQATAAGGRVSVRTRTCDGEQPSCVYIEVEDTGKGIAPEEAAKAFQPFFSTKTQGTGLGLPIAKRIVESHHGRISLESTPGKGTCVRVELPVGPGGRNKGT